MSFKLGAHQSISGGYSEALDRINNIDGNCLQIFSSSPRGWNFAKPTEEEISQFVDLKKKLKIEPIYFHATYLINLADDSRIGHMSKLSLITELNLASKLNVKGSIVHLGSFKDQRSNIKEILEKTPKDTLFIIENAGNRKIGQTLEEISQIVKDVNNSRVRICFDTCHLFSNGYRFNNNDELDLFFTKLAKLKIVNIVE